MPDNIGDNMAILWGFILNLSRFELHARFNRLGIPIRIGPETVEEARSEYEVLMQTVGR